MVLKMSCFTKNTFYFFLLKIFLYVQGFKFSSINGFDADQLIDFENYLLVHTEDYISNLQNFNDIMNQNLLNTPIRTIKTFLSQQKDFLDKLHEINKRCLIVFDGILGSGQCIQRKNTGYYLDLSNYTPTEDIIFDITKALMNINDTSHLIADDLYRDLLNPYNLSNIAFMSYLIICIQNAFDSYYKNIVFFAVFCIRINRFTNDNPGYLYSYDLGVILLHYYKKFVSFNLSFTSFLRKILGCKLIKIKSKKHICLHNKMPGNVVELMKLSLAEKTQLRQPNLDILFRSYYLYCCEVMQSLSSRIPNAYSSICIESDIKISYNIRIPLTLLRSNQNHVKLQVNIIQMIRKFEQIKSSHFDVDLLREKHKKTENIKMSFKIEENEKEIFHFFKRNKAKIRTIIEGLFHTLERPINTSDQPHDYAGISFFDNQKIDALKVWIEDSLSEFQKFEEYTFRFDIYKSSEVKPSEYSLCYYCLILQLYGKNLVYLSWVINQISRYPCETGYSGFIVSHVKSTIVRLSKQISTINGVFSGNFCTRFSFDFTRLEHQSDQRQQTINEVFSYWEYRRKEYFSLCVNEENSLLLGEINRLLTPIFP